MSNSRTRILEAAEKAIQERGFEKSTIAQIARQAQVADSLIYQHFKGKQALLFALAEQWMEMVLKQLQDHLEGITDPLSRLRKMVWYSLKFNDLNQGFARALLFQCRSQKSFYATPAYQLIRRYAGSLLEILHHGVQEKAFRDDMDMRIVRDIILGVLDFSAIQYLIESESAQCVDRLDDIMALITPMVMARPESATDSKADRILEAAEEVIAEKGFAKAQITEIARLAGVADGTIYEYFKDKEALLMAIPEKYFAKELRSQGEEQTPSGPGRRLQGLVRQHFMLHLSNRRFLKVFLLNIQLNMRFYDSSAYENYSQYLNLIRNTIDQGRQSGDFRKEVEPHVFVDMLLGSLSNMALRWLIVEEDQETDKMAEIEQVVELLCDAVCAASRNQG